MQSLDQRLKRDCYQIGRSEPSELLLMRNALFPWFVIVPYTEELEFYRLPEKAQLQLLKQVNGISLFLKESLLVHKINVATIGNVVSQMHIHIVGRFTNDVCWPNVVWGADQFSAYSNADLDQLIQAASTALSSQFQIDKIAL